MRERKRETERQKERERERQRETEREKDRERALPNILMIWGDPHPGSKGPIVEDLVSGPVFSVDQCLSLSGLSGPVAATMFFKMSLGSNLSAEP